MAAAASVERCGPRMAQERLTQWWPSGAAPLSLVGKRCWRRYRRVAACCSGLHLLFFSLANGCGALEGPNERADPRHCRAAPFSQSPKAASNPRESLPKRAGLVLQGGYWDADGTTRGRAKWDTKDDKERRAPATRRRLRSTCLCWGGCRKSQEARQMGGSSGGFMGDNRTWSFFRIFFCQGHFLFSSTTSLSICPLLSMGMRGEMA